MRIKENQELHNEDVARCNAEIAAKRSLDCPECNGSGWNIGKRKLSCGKCRGLGFYDPFRR